MGDRAIVHLDLDAFYVAVERVVSPRLRDRPVLVAFGGRCAPRTVVASVSYEAREAGIERGMPLRRARRLCPDVEVLPGSPDLYERASKALFEVLSDFTPSIEPAGRDEAYLDLSGTGRLLGVPADAGSRIQREVRDRLRLEASVGLGTNKMLSKVAAGCAKPSGFCDVSPGWEAAFLRPLRVRRMPGVGEATERRLLDFNLRRCGEVAEVPARYLEWAFGARGRLLSERARGYDPSPVRPRGPVRSVASEMTFDTDTNERPAVEAALRRLVERACGGLRGQGRLARTVAVRMRFADGIDRTRQQTLRMPTDLEQDLAPAARELLERLWERRVRVRQLGVRCTGLVGGPEQGDLFDDITGADAWTPTRAQRGRALAGAVDRVRAKHGFEALTSGRALEAPRGQMGREAGGHALRVSDRTSEADGYGCG
ncbi:MAG: DNA polymerase IV [bacterium]